MLAAAGCLVTTTLTTVLAGSGWKLRAVVFSAAVIPLLAWCVGSLKDLLLFFWVGSLTYNRQFFSFDRFIGAGTQGFFWVLADIFFVGLLVIWAYEATKGQNRRDSAQKAPALWPFFLPFAGAAVLSIFAAERPDWSLYELMRYVRFALILAYVRHNVGRREWWIIITALCAAMVFQSLIAVKEVVTGQSGVVGTDVSSSLEGLEEDFSMEGFYGMVRATATMNHPPNLASYLTMLIPVALALALTLKNFQLRLMATIALLIAGAGLAATMSRLPILMTAMAVVAVLLVLSWFREISLKQSLGILILGVCALMIAAIPMRDKIMSRVTTDFSASVDQRMEGLRGAMSIVMEENTFFGIGLNNTRLFVAKYLPEISWMDETDPVLIQMNVRPLATMGNAYSHVAVETGLIGFLAFTLLLVGTFIIGWRAFCRTTGPVRGVALGLTVGWIGILGGQVVDHSIFVDPQLYTNAIVFALLNLTPTLFPAQTSLQEAGQP